MNFKSEFKQRAKELVAKMTLAEKLSQMKYDAPAIERLGVPAYNWWNECLHGVARSGAATVFPQAISMAASFNTELMNEVGSAISDEARAKYNRYREMGYTDIYQGLTYWSPNINIFRDPRWGRGHETYGEDPYLTGRMGTAFIKGLQEGDDPKYRKLDATIKHYAVHSGPEADRHSFDAIVGEKDLYETYLWAFKYCIDNADPSSVMGAYNRINGEAACASETYLKGILYGEFGFDGYVVSDCGAICDINEHHKITANAAESSAIAVKNGCQLNCGSAYVWLKTSVAAGLLDEETVTEAVERLFTARYRLGMFDDDCVYDKIPYDVVECKKHRDLSLQMAREGIVMLKNDGILPLKGSEKIAVIGPLSDDKLVLLANYSGMPSDYTTLLRGLKSRFENIQYAAGCHLYKDVLGAYEEKPMNEAILAAKNADVVIFCLGLNATMEGEEGDGFNGDDGGDKKNIEFPKSQMDLYNEVAKLGKPMIFTSIAGSCMNLTKQDAECNAVLHCFYPGAEAGTAFAEILLGDVSPSGRLPVTFYKNTDELPPFDDYSMENRTYKFFKGEPLYAFGHGLSYADIDENWTDENTAVITNNSSVDTLYTVLKYEYIPHKNLCGFKKVLIKGDSTLTVKF